MMLPISTLVCISNRSELFGFVFNQTTVLHKTCLDLGKYSILKSGFFSKR